MKRIAFIINPISGTSQKKAVVEYLKLNFTASRGYEPLFYYTKGPGDAYTASLGFCRDNYDIVVAVGGDGTVNQVAKGLLHSNTKLGIIPMGSGNGLARHMKIPLSYYGAVGALLEGKYEVIDAGKINDEIFFCTAGLGFEAVIGDRFNTAGTRGLITYMEYCAKEYVKYVRESYKIEIGDASYDYKAFLITFANSAQWGNNVFIAPDASISDGMLDMVIWKRAPLVSMPIIAAGLILKKIQHSEYIDSFRTKSVRIKRSKPGLIQFDGESRMMGEDIEVSVIEHAVKVIVPANTDLLAFTKYIVPQLKDMLPKIPEL
ncbi:MAG: diacylglycerol kinase family lipid kinase [Bacteroidales bacterium]|nr:diacylglycerol kinase family lipid kinase [Bacteroidales bacterium]